MIINDIQEKYLKMVFNKKELDSNDITVDYRGDELSSPLCL